MKGWNEMTVLGFLSKELITDIIGSRFSLAIGKDLGFGMFKMGTTLERNWLNVSKSSLSLDMVLPSSTRLIFHLLMNF